MLTVKDYLQYKESVTSEKQQKCDEWLQQQVFPKFSGNGFGIECPNWAGLTEMQLMLEQRGWSVTTHSGYQGSFLYLSFPPQGE